MTDVNYPQILNTKIAAIKYIYNNKNQVTNVDIKNWASNSYQSFKSYQYNDKNEVENIFTSLYSGGNYYQGTSYQMYNYDIFGRIVSIGEMNGGFTYSYDNNNRIIQENRLLGQSISETRSYTYDAAGRVIFSIKNPFGSPVLIYYSYDVVGNRIDERHQDNTGNCDIVSYYNSLNQLINTQKMSGNSNISTQYSYDNYGNQATSNYDNNCTYYQYDSMNHLVFVFDNYNSVSEQNNYISDGTRISKSTNNKVLVSYHYENGVLHYTSGNVGQILNENINTINDGLTATVYNNQYYYYAKDIRNSTSHILDSNGDINTYYVYSTFGETEAFTDPQIVPVNNEICFTGAIYDEETGLYYMNARYYNPANARFISQDSYRGEKDDYQSLHLYVYCANDPINNTDPSGHWARPTHKEITKKAVDYVLLKSALKNFTTKKERDQIISESDWPDRHKSETDKIKDERIYWHGNFDNFRKGVAKSKNLFNLHYFSNSKLAFRYLACGLHTAQDYSAHSYHKHLGLISTSTDFKVYKKANHTKKIDNKYMDFVEKNKKYVWVKQKNVGDNKRYQLALDMTIDILNDFVSRIKTKLRNYY